MAEIVRGHRSKLSDLGCSSTLSTELMLAPAAGSSIDVACFGVDADGKLSDDRYMVFFNQMASPGNAIVLSSAGHASTFALRLDDLPLTIERLVFAASLDGAGSMRGLGASSMTIGNAVFRFSGNDFDTEKAVIVAELYRRNGQWRFCAVGQGFAGGLSALLTHFGGTEAAPAAASAPAAAAPPAPAPAPAKVSLSKITLTKAGERHTVSLVKGAAAPRKITVRATWQDNGDGDDDNDDLDLRVGILLADGRMKLVTAPAAPGALDRTPYVLHCGDVTMASAKMPATETVEVNAGIAGLVGGRVALVFSVYSALGNGAVSVASLKPVMRMEYGDQVVECAYDFTRSAAAKDDSVYTYVIGTAIIDGDTIVLAPSGLTSEPGSENTPWMRWNGADVRVSLDGPAVFKDDDDGDEAREYNAGNPNRYSQ